MSTFQLAGLSLCLAALAFAQPQVTAVTNAADYTPTLSPGSIATIFGTGLAPSEMSAAATPLPTTLNTVSIMVSGKAAPLFYVNSSQINFQVPYSTKTGTATLTVTAGGKQSSAVQVVVAAYSPGILQYGTDGHGVIQNQDYSVNSPMNPAASRSYIVVYMTGLGVTNSQLTDGVPVPSTPLSSFTGKATAKIGDTDAPVQFIGMTPGFVGLSQLNVQVPALPSGDYPLYVSLNDYQYPSVWVSVIGSTPGFQPSKLLNLVSIFSLPGVGTTVVPGISGIVANSLALYSNTLYVCSAYDIKVVDVTNPAAPNFVKVINDSGLGGSAHNCAVNLSAPQPFLVDIVRDSQSLPVYDLTNPVAPTKRSQNSVSIVPRSLAFSGSIAFLGEDLFSYSGHNVNFTEGNILSVDFSNLSSPAAGPLVQNNAAHPETNHGNLRPYMLVPSPKLLYVASTTASQNFDTGVGALDLFDVTNPKAVVGAGQIQVAGTKMLLTLAVQGTEMLAAGDTRGYSPGNSSPILDFPFMGFLTLTMFDTTDPANPKMQGNIIVQSMQPGNVGGPISLGSVSLGGGFFALTCAAHDPNADGGSPNGSLVLVDARDPQNPQAYTYSTLSGLGGLSVANGYLYVARGSGASIYKINLP